jgi:hypothetical protein
MVIVPFVSLKFDCHIFVGVVCHLRAVDSRHIFNLHDWAKSTSCPRPYLEAAITKEKDGGLNVLWGELIIAVDLQGIVVELRCRYLRWMGRSTLIELFVINGDG